MYPSPVIYDTGDTDLTHIPHQYSPGGWEESALLYLNDDSKRSMVSAISYKDNI